jgi:hypothetical protein
MNASDLVIQLHDLARETKDNRIRKIADELSDITKEHRCNPHPDAPHGFLRDASHSAGRYVCECEWWDEKDYELATLEEAEEFDKKRNYHYTNTTNPIDFP